MSLLSPWRIVIFGGCGKVSPAVGGCLQLTLVDAQPRVGNSFASVRGDPAEFHYLQVRERTTHLHSSVVASRGAGAKKKTSIANLVTELKLTFLCIFECQGSGWTM